MLAWVCCLTCEIHVFTCQISQFLSNVKSNVKLHGIFKLASAVYIAYVDKLWFGLVYIRSLCATSELNKYLDPPPPSHMSPVLAAHCEMKTPPLSKSSL